MLVSGKGERRAPDATAVVSGGRGSFVDLRKGVGFEVDGVLLAKGGPRVVRKFRVRIVGEGRS